MENQANLPVDILKLMQSRKDQTTKIIFGKTIVLSRCDYEIRDPHTSRGIQDYNSL